MTQKGFTSEEMALSKSDYSRNLLIFILATLVGVFIFFVPIMLEGVPQIPFGIIVNWLVGLFGPAMVWLVFALVIFNAVGYILGKTVMKDSWFGKQHENDPVIQGILYILGAVYVTFVAIGTGPEWIISGGTGGVVVKDIAQPVTWIVPLGGLFVTLFIAFGGLDFIGTLLEPLMRPIFRLPGRSALDSLASLVGASSIGAYISARIYKEKMYTKRECVSIATSFCVVSIGFAMICATAVDLMHIFPTIFLSYVVISYLMAIIMVRIPPLSRIQNVYVDGTEQTEEDRKEGIKLEGIFKRAVNRAINRSASSEGIVKEVSRGFLDGARLIPKILALIAAVGVTALIIAEYTAFFDYLGRPVVPLLNLFRIPDAELIAASTLIGITEMYLPVLLISGLEVSLAARYFICVLTLVQIIFFAETAVVMLITGVPTNFGQLVILFLERTIIAIPIIALFMHILF